MIALREQEYHIAAKERADAQESEAISTPNDRVGTAATTGHRSIAEAACTGLRTRHGATGAAAKATWDSRRGRAKDAGG